MNALGLIRTLLDRRDWVYSLSLLIPFAIYNLTLKALEIASLPGDNGLSHSLYFMRSAMFFNLGYALLWVGLFAAVRSRKRPLHWFVVSLFHTVTMFVVIVTTCAYQYFQETGAPLKYGTITGWLSRSDDMKQLLQSVPLSVWVLLAATLLYAALGPFIFTRTVERWREWSESIRAGRLEVFSFSISLGLCLLALGLGLLSLDAGATALARDSFVNVIVPGVEEAEEDNPATAPTAGGDEEPEENDSDTAPGVGQPAAHATLAQTPQTEKRNVVLVHLESTRARSVTPYNEDLKTTPFLDELAKQSLLVEQAHVGSIPRSLMSSISVNCGIQPPPRLGEESDPTGAPVPCLAGLLKDQGYNTAFFSSNADEYVKYATSHWGYQEAFAPPDLSVPAEYRDASMDTSNFMHTSHYGYEEDIMLQPSENWLNEHKDGPFMAEYLMNTGHDEYRCLDSRYGSVEFSNDDLLDHYLNCMRLQDIFLQHLIDQYKEMGLYENTIFVLFGDHGEGFGEHGRFMHGDTIWEEGLRVPLIIHAPGWFEDGERAEGLSNYTDILPTVLEMLGYEVKDGEYPGYSLLHPLPADRTLMFSCISRRECVASLMGNEKYIYHYDNQPEEVFDLSNDPLEEHNLAGEYSKEDLEKRRKDIFAWLSRIDAQYYGYESLPRDGQEDTEQQASQQGGQPAGSTVQVGEPLTVGGAEWTVTSVRPADTLTSSVDGGTKRGNFIVVDFQLKNNGTEGLNLSSKSLALFDGSGRKFEFDTDAYLYIDRAKNLFRVEAQPGVSQAGEIIFEVPPGTSQLQLQLREATNPFSDESGYVNLGL